MISCRADPQAAAAGTHRQPRLGMAASAGDREFRIAASDVEQSGPVFVSPDVATCADCLAEMFDPADRRYRYPFLNCTNCGPRLTIITGAPYDRARTTMAGFPMCSACRAEYDDPANRRFHAQPTACPTCGPRLQLSDAPAANRWRRTIRSPVSPRRCGPAGSGR